MGIPEEEAHWYEQEVKGGRTLVTVKADGRYDEAQALLRRHGAYDIETGAQATTGTRSAGMAETGRGATSAARPAAGRGSGRGRSERDEGRRMELREEELQVRKETHEVGEVEVRKEVVSEQRTVDVPIRREEVSVERHPTERRPSDRPIGEGEKIEVPVREEEVTLEKRPVVYEEVEIGKRQIEETRQVSGQVRREVAHVETEGDVTVPGATGGRSSFRSWDEYGPTYRQEWQSRSGSSGRRWEDEEPYHRYGYEMAHDPRYQGREWHDVEPTLRTDYQDWARRNNYRQGDSAWDDFKQRVRESWDSARAQVRR
jgi:uncharacterized protein (TIGR02271 family)